MQKLFSFIFLIAVYQLINAQSFNYLPSPVGDNQILTYSEFTLSYNEEHEQADWVAYELTSDEVYMARERCDCFARDPNVITGSAGLNDYASSGFDRGHLSPAADNKATEQANRESFLLSNMSPQLPGFNRGKWEEFEDWVRDQAKSYDTIYVVTGPVFINNLGKMGNNEVTIPGYFYKVLLRFDETSVKTIAFLVPHVGAIGIIKDYIVTVNTIETLTGIDFFPALDNSIENRVESQFEPGQWGLN